MYDSFKHAPDACNLPPVPPATCMRRRTPLPEQRVTDTNRVPTERVSSPSRETTHPQVEVEIRPSRTRRRTWRGLLREIIGEHHHAIHQVMHGRATPGWCGRRRVLSE